MRSNQSGPVLFSNYLRTTLILYLSGRPFLFKFSAGLLSERVALWPGLIVVSENWNSGPSSFPPDEGPKLSRERAPLALLFLFFSLAQLHRFSRYSSNKLSNLASGLPVSSVPVWYLLGRFVEGEYGLHVVCSPEVVMTLNIGTQRKVSLFPAHLFWAQQNLPVPHFHHLLSSDIRSFASFWREAVYGNGKGAFRRLWKLENQHRTGRGGKHQIVSKGPVLR